MHQQVDAKQFLSKLMMQPATFSQDSTKWTAFYQNVAQARKSAAKSDCVLANINVFGHVLPIFLTLFDLIHRKQAVGEARADKAN